MDCDLKCGPPEPLLQAALLWVLEADQSPARQLARVSPMIRYRAQRTFLEAQRVHHWGQRLWILASALDFRFSHHDTFRATVPGGCWYQPGSMS